MQQLENHGGGNSNVACQETLTLKTSDKPAKSASFCCSPVSTAAINPKSTSLSSGISTLQNKEVQTEFPAGMLEEYVLENRRRVLKLLRYPPGLALSYNDRKTVNTHPWRNNANETKTFENVAQQLGAKGEVLQKRYFSPTNKTSNHRNCSATFNKQFESSTSGSVSPDSSLNVPIMKRHLSNSPLLFRQRCLSESPPPPPLSLPELPQQQKGHLKKIASSHPYAQSFDHQDPDTINFQPLLQRPPRNLALAENNNDDDKGAKELNSERACFFIEKCTNKSHLKPPNSLSIGMNYKVITRLISQQPEPYETYTVSDITCSEVQCSNASPRTTTEGDVVLKNDNFVTG